MGVDTKMFVRIKGRDNWLKPEGERRAAYELSSTVGYQHFGITIGQGYSWGEHHALEIMKPIKDEDDASEYGLDPGYVGKVVYTQDGDEVVAGDDEQFVQVHLWTRYYHEDYARGDWPTIRAVAEWCELRFPGAEVWYGGDSSGMCAEHLTVERRDTLNKFYLGSGRKSYVRYDSGIPRTFGGSNARPVCTVCDVGMFDVGGSRDYTFWSCDGCGGKVVAHGDGRRFTGNQHDDFGQLSQGVNSSKRPRAA